jgi:hypothetical protein
LCLGERPVTFVPSVDEHTLLHRGSDAKLLPASGKKPPRQGGANGNEIFTQQGQDSPAVLQPALPTPRLENPARFPQPRRSGAC